MCIMERHFNIYNVQIQRDLQLINLKLMIYRYIMFL
jgi:hypothetical protein